MNAVGKNIGTQGVQVLFLCLTKNESIEVGRWLTACFYKVNGNLNRVS